MIGRWLPRLGAGLALVVVAIAATPSSAEPAFAARTGYRCSQCHANRTGGGLRTAFGSLYTQLILPRSTLRWRARGNLLPANPDARVAFGANFRGQYVDTSSPESPTSRSFEIPEANVYAQARLIPERLSLYVDQTLGPGGSSARELFGLYEWRPARGYLKVGKFLPAYGWRLPDDAAFIRQNTGFSYQSPDIGVEIGFEPGSWSVHLSTTNGAGGGSDDNSSKRLALMSVKRFRKWRIGAMGAQNTRDNVTTRAGGLLAGVNFGRVTLLGEGDWGESSSTHRLIGFAEANILIARGLNLKLAHDWIDPDDDASTDERTRDSIGLEYIPIPWVQLRWLVRFRDGPPQVSGARDDSLELEAHLFF